MGNNNSPAATAHIKAIANKALETTNGISVIVPTQQEALRLRSGFITVRYRDRKDSRQIYPSDNPMHGHSPYDGLTTLIEELPDKRWKFTLRDFKIGLKDFVITNEDTGTPITGDDLI